MTPKLSKVIRLDSLPLSQTYFTNEGYLVDRPILTSTGIFEYSNPDGSIRRELRLPEDVFDPESLKSYKGRPIIITHDAGLVTKDNVKDHQIGTILTEGYRSKDDVRAEIIIHDTDGMQSAGLKELSLGYNLDLEETPGEWEGQHYDAIQRNIRINHLALVREARAGEQARLNIDGRDTDNTLKGGKVMSKNTNPKAKANAHRNDGALSPENFAKAIEDYKARRAERIAAKVDSEVKPAEEPATEPVVVVDEQPAVVEATTPEEKVQLVKDRRDRRDENGDPEDLAAAKGVIAHQDEDIDMLFDIIDTMLAQGDFQKTDSEAVVETPAVEEPAAVVEDEDDNDEPVVGAAVDGTDCDNNDEDTDPVPTTNAAEIDKSVLNVDSVDAIVRQRIQLGLLGRKLNMDGLENMSISAAKKAVILAVRPSLNLDGKSVAYINAAYDCAVADVNARNQKGTGYQKSQMFNKDSRATESDGRSSTDARQRMIDRQMKKKEEK